MSRLKHKKRNEYWDLDAKDQLVPGKTGNAPLIPPFPIYTWVLSGPGNQAKPPKHRQPPPIPTHPHKSEEESLLSTAGSWGPG